MIKGRLLKYIFLLLIFFSCNNTEKDPITIEIYKTVGTMDLYGIIFECDSFMNSYFHENPIDTNSLPNQEQMVLRNSTSKSDYVSIRVSPIIGRFADIYQPDYTGQYKLCSPVFFGTADCSDTNQINAWLQNANCTGSRKQDFTYKWFINDSNSDEAKLVGLRSGSPFITLNQSDIDSAKLTPNYGLAGLVNLFSDVKTEASSYSLDIVLKQSIAQKITNEMASDSTSGYLAIIRSGQYTYNYAIHRRTIMNSRTLERVTIIDKEVIPKFIQNFGLKVFTVE